MATRGGKGGGSMADLLASNDTGEATAIGEAAREVAKVFETVAPEIAKNLAALDQSIKDTESAFADAAKHGDSSSKEMTAAIERIAEAQKNYAEKVEELTQNQVPTVKEAKKIAKEFAKFRKQIETERKALVGASMVAGAGPLNRLGRTLRTTEGRQAFLRKKFGLGDDNVLMAGTRRGVAGRALAAGAAEISAGAGGIAAMLGRAGPWGAVAGVVAAGIASIFKKQAEAMKATVPVFANFGMGGAEGFNRQRQQMEDVLNKAKNAARDWGGDAEAAAATVVKIAQETGRAGELVDGAIALRIEKLRTIGVGTTEELGDILIKRVRETGMSLSAAMTELEDVTRTARTIAGDDTTGLVATMHDFYRAIDELRSGSDALHVSFSGLSKVMKLSMVTAKQLGMTQDRALKAARAISNAIVNTYDEGFAAINIQADLQAAMASTDKKIADDAAFINEKLLSGQLDPMAAARMLKSAGGATDTGVIMQRLDRLTQEFGGNVHIAAAQMGIQEITPDMLRLLEAFQDARGRAGSMQGALDAMSEKDRAGFQEFLTEAGKQLKLDPGKQMEKVLDDIALALSKTLPNALTKVADVLDSVLKLIEEIRREGVFGIAKNTATGIDDATGGAAGKAAQTLAVGAAGPVAIPLLAAKAVMDAKKLSPEENDISAAIKRKVDRISGGTTSNMSLADALATMEAAQQIELSKKVSAQEKAVLEKIALPTNAKVLRSAIRADGKEVGVMEVQYEVVGPSASQSAMELAEERAARMGRRP